MQHWDLQECSDTCGLLPERLPRMVAALGTPHYAGEAVQALGDVMPVGSWAVYRVGPQVEPALLISGSHGMPDLTRQCWGAYLSGPYARDRSLLPQASQRPAALRVHHVAATEMPREHRQLVYEPYGVVERLSLVEAFADGSGLMALNFYRHAHQAPLDDCHIRLFRNLGPVLLALTRKHLSLQTLPQSQSLQQPSQVENLPHQKLPHYQRLLQLAPALTQREIEVCLRLLQGMTYEGIAADLQVRPSTVKTYRNRAFLRLGIHYRNELFAKIAAAGSNTGNMH